MTKCTIFIDGGHMSRCTILIDGVCETSNSLIPLSTLILYIRGEWTELVNVNNPGISCVSY